MDRNELAETPLQRLIRQRKSVRKYLDKKVEREKIIACLDAARRAPSAENVQPWRFLVIDDPEIKEAFSREVFSGIYSFSRFAARAPVLVLILGRLDILANRVGKQIQNVNFFLIDIGIAGQQFVLQAEELNLGTCWIGWFNMRKARKVLRIPRKYRIVSMLSVGYPEKRSDKERPRKTLEEISWFNEISDRKLSGD